MKNFVFDLYGTLVDIRTDEHSQSFKNKYLKHIKNFGADGTFFEKFFEILSAFSGFDEPDILQVIQGAVTASGGSITDSEAEEAALNFRKFSTHKLKLYSGVKRLLKGLKRSGAKVYLLSNAQAAFTVYELKKLGIYGCFDGIELSSDFGKKKPSPEFFAYLIDKYSLNIGETVFTGNDLACDIIPSREAGMYTVYVKTAISPADDNLLKATNIADFATDSTSTAYRHLIALASS